MERSQQLLATGASRIATACPFCYVMIDDGVKGEGIDEDEVRVADIAIHTLEALERGEERATAVALTPTVSDTILPITTGAGQPRGATATAVRPAPATARQSNGGGPGEPASNGDGDAEPAIPEAESSGAADDAPTADGDDDTVERSTTESEPVVDDPEPALADAEFESPATETPSEDAEADSATAPVEAAVPAEADDLTQLLGIGTSLQEILSELGITTFDQLAAMDDEYRRRLDDYLSFEGRIERDNWVGQAAELASGKTAELPDIPG